MFWRILLFYVLAILVIGLLIPYTDPNLLKSEVTDVSVSPFTLIFQNAGIAFAASLSTNTVILTAALGRHVGHVRFDPDALRPCRRGQRPENLCQAERHGVPRNALYATA